MTERIYIQVDDTELTALTGKLNTSMKRVKTVGKDAAKLDVSTKQLLTQLPLLREVDMLTQRMKAMGTGEAGAMIGLGPVAGALLLIQVMITLLEKLERMERQVIRDRGAYETMVRGGLDLTHEEWAMLSREQVGFASAFEQFTEESKDNFFAAAEEYMRFLYVKYTVAPVPGTGIYPSYVGEDNLP